MTTPLILHSFPLLIQLIVEYIIFLHVHNAIPSQAGDGVVCYFACL